jgi:predicted membrane metal-binding protein
MNPIDFSQWTAITTSPQFLIVSLIYFLTPLIFYLIHGAIAHGKDSSGRSRTKCMLMYGNFWVSVLYYTLIGGALYLGLIVFPLWIRIFS